jgi:hypothetical protein
MLKLISETSGGGHEQVDEADQNGAGLWLESGRIGLSILDEVK